MPSWSPREGSSSSCPPSVSTRDGPTIESARAIAKRLVADGYDAYHSQILIEDAVREADIIIAPEGITGNIIFRTMHLVGGAKALGAPVVNSDRVFIDTSRAKTDYRDSLALAMRLSEE